MPRPKSDILIDGVALRRLRERKLQLGQLELALRAGVSESTVRKIESGEKPGIAGTTFWKLAKGLGLAEDEALRVLTKKPATEGTGEERFEMVMMQRRPFFDVKIPAGSWVETEPRERPDGYVPVPGDLPADAFCLRIFGECMEPDFPNGAVIVFVPVRDGERDALQFEDGRPYYFEHSDGKATFKLVFYEKDRERFRLQPINPKCKTFYVPEQMKARVSRAVKMMKDVS